MGLEEEKDVSMDAGSSDAEGKAAAELPHSDDDDSSEDSEAEDDNASMELVVQLEAALSASPDSYETHVQYIAALRKAGVLEKLRAAREAMHARFPLVPTLWLEWTTDEARLASSAEEFLAVEGLFERAVQEYLAVPLWVAYLDFVEEHDSSVAQCAQEGLTKMRQLCERALSVAGLHVTEGSKIWGAYREFEEAVLIAFNESSSEVKARQIDRVRSLFHRQLKVPLANHSEVLEEYNAWERQLGNQIGNEAQEETGIPPSVAFAYKKAVELYTTRQPFEEKVAEGKPADVQLLQNFMEYISAEEAAGDPARVQIIVERALAVFPVTPDLWLKYMNYLETNLKVPKVIVGVYVRAIRNCPWEGMIWTRYLLALERYSYPETAISSVFEQALQIGFQSPLVYLDLLLTRADGIRRRIAKSTTGPDQSDVALLRETFNRAVQFLSSHPDLFDRTLQLHTYWANVESRIIEDLAAARGAWETLLKSSGRFVEAWQGYIAMEVALDNVDEARAIYKRCYSRRFEDQGTQVLCDAWLLFEREHGSLEDYDRALLKVGPRVKEVQSILTQQEAKTAALHRWVKNDYSVGKVKAGVAKGVTKVTNDLAAKKKRGLGHAEPEPRKRLKRGEIEKKAERAESSGDPKATVTVKQDAVSVEIGQSLGDKDMVDADVGSPGTCKKDVLGEGAGQKGPVSDLADSIEECTVFVKNLRFEAGKEELEEFFSSTGGVKEVRVVRERNTGRSRGFAYVEFESDDYVASAVAKDGEQFMGRRISISRSNPKTSERGSSGQRRGRGRGRGGRSGLGDRSGGGLETEDRGGDGDGRGRGAAAFVGHRRGGHVALKGNNTFALPRAVMRPLGWNPGRDKPPEDAAPKSNEEFRNLLKKP